MREAGGILGEIVARKRIDVAARLEGRSLDDLRGQATTTTRSLKAALARPGARFVMEVKRASPSAGALASVDPAAQARAYAGAADAVSVLTDTPYFGGSLDDLAAVRAAYDGPILAKDFMIDPRQVVEARLHGADAVLAMLSVLDDEDAREVLAEAERFGMDVLVEAHGADEVARAVALGAAVIGINNRDLRTLEVDLAVTERLAHLVPADRILVAESGIADRADVERLAPHADAFLVGSSLMRSPDPRAAARALAFGRVKLCGLTREEDVVVAASAGATFAGLILVPGTPRAVCGDTAHPLSDTARAHDLATVGVFRNAPLTEVADMAERLALDVLQLHGREDEAYVAELRAALKDRVEIWAAADVGETIAEPRAGADRILFDTAIGGRSGGTGCVFDWARVAARADLPRAILAGGINPANARAAAAVGAFAIDVGSGVEAEPGIKDAAKVTALFDALRIPAWGE